MLDIADLLKVWTTDPLLSVTTPSSGVMNQTFLLKTAIADYALRAYRPLPRERIEL